MADIQLLHFSGGLQTTTSSFLRKSDQLELAINVHFDQIGSVSKRLGYSQVSTALTASVKEMATYSRQSDGTQNLFAIAGGVLSYYNGTSWNSVQSGLDSSVLPNFRVYVDQLFIVGSNGTSTFLTPINVAGTTYSTSTNLGSAPTGAQFIEIYKGRVYMADCVVGGVRYPSRFYYSSVPSSGTNITWDTSGTSTSFEDVYTNNGEPIMGLHTNKTLNKLLIFKQTSLHAWDTFRLQDVGNVGTTANRSIQTINFTTYFFNEKGIFKYTGSEPTLISRPIQKWIEGIDQTQTGNVFAAAFDNRFYKLYVGNVTVDGVTYNNCEIQYSVLDDTFTINSYNDTLTCYALHKESSKIRIYAGESTGKVMKLAARDDTQYSDNDVAIPAQFMTKALDLEMPNNRKFVDRVIIYCTRPQNLQGRMRVRGKDWSTYFPIDDYEHEVSINPDDGRFLQFHFTESSTNRPFLLEGMTFHATQTTHDNA